jgi:glycerol-3-phosphate dehydrogenase (NAD(P)+)
MGQVIAQAVRRAAIVHLWDSEEGKVEQQLPLEQTLPKARVVFLCVPSFAVRAAALRAIPLLKRQTAFITVAKGIEEASGETMAELLYGLLHKHHHRFALLSGPMLADEFDTGQPGYGVLAGLPRLQYTAVVRLFAGSQIKLSYSADAAGVAYAGVLKNVYTLGLGMLAGLNVGNNVRGWYVSEALKESRIILQKLGAHANTADSWAGIGDLVTSGFSDKSRNYGVGRDIALGKPALSSEGTRSLPLIYNRLGRTTRKLPVLQSLVAIVTRGKNPNSLLTVV